MEEFTVLILGAGKIGAMFDKPGIEQVLTHAHAFTRHPAFRLLGFVDPDQQQAAVAAEVWGGVAFPTIAEAFAHNSVDVVVVATPDETHFTLLRELVSYPLRLVFAEKPLTLAIKESEAIISLYHDSRITLALNYTRRYVHEFTVLKNNIASGTYGKLLVGTGYYGKGILHNGSHMIDLIRFLLGEISATRTLSCISDCFDNDPTCSAELSLANGGRFVMQGVDCRCHTIFEIDLVFATQRVRLIESGFKIELYSVQDSAIFAGYRTLSFAEMQPTEQGQALLRAVDSIHSHLTNGVPVPCSGEDGLIAQRICHAIRRGLA